MIPEPEKWLEDKIRAIFRSRAMILLRDDLRESGSDTLLNMQEVWKQNCVNCFAASPLVKYGWSVVILYQLPALATIRDGGEFGSSWQKNDPKDLYPGSEVPASLEMDIRQSARSGTECQRDFRLRRKLLLSVLVRRRLKRERGNTRRPEKRSPWLRQSAMRMWYHIRGKAEWSIPRKARQPGSDPGYRRGELCRVPHLTKPSFVFFRSQLCSRKGQEHSVTVWISAVTSYYLVRHCSYFLQLNSDQN